MCVWTTNTYREAQFLLIFFIIYVKPEQIVASYSTIKSMEKLKFKFKLKALQENEMVWE